MHSPSHLFSFFFLSIASSFSPPPSPFSLCSLADALLLRRQRLRPVSFQTQKAYTPCARRCTNWKTTKATQRTETSAAQSSKMTKTLSAQDAAPPSQDRHTAQTNIQTHCHADLHYWKRAETHQRRVQELCTHFSKPLSSWFKSEQEANIQLLRAWERSWNTAGWKTKVLTRADAQSHPDFAKFNRILDTVPLGTNIMYDKMCFVRHLAMAQAGGGWMADFDTIPLHIKPGMPPPNNGRWTSQESGVPSLVSGNKSEWLLC